MKKILLLISLITVLSGYTQYTPSGDALPDGGKDLNYSQVIGVDMPTLVEVGGAQVSSLIVSAFPPAQLYISSISEMTIPLLNLSAQLSVNGLPSGISSSCSPSDCSFPGGNSGSIYLNGVPSVEGTYNIVITSNSYGTLDLSALTALSGGLIPNSLAITEPLTGVFDKEYLLVIEDQTSINKLNNGYFSGLSLYPNPASTQTAIKFYSQENYDVTIRISDLNGRIVASYKFMVENGWNEIPMNLNFDSGIYIVAAKNSNFEVREILLIAGFDE